LNALFWLGGEPEAPTGQVAGRMLQRPNPRTPLSP
jgi:hypothetical protein